MFDYQGVSVLVFRIEDRDGRGPWSSAYPCRWMYDYEITDEHSPGSYLPSHSMCDPSKRFGFKSVQQMIEAFPVTMLVRALRTGNWFVAIYECPQQHVREMDDKQVTFDVTFVDTAKRIADIQELYDVLKTPADNRGVCPVIPRCARTGSDVRVSDGAATLMDGSTSYEIRGPGWDREPVPVGMEA